MRDWKHIRMEPPAEPWFETLLGFIGFVALCAVLLTAPQWGTVIDGMCR